jgi:hypothetical protein
MLDFALIGLTCVTCIVFGFWHYGPLGGLAGVGFYILLMAGLFAVTLFRHRRLIQRWAGNNRLVAVSVDTKQGFIDPAPMPWWQHGTAYDVLVRTPEGAERKLDIFITGTFFVLFRLEVSVERDEDTAGEVAG